MKRPQTSDPPREANHATQRLITPLACGQRRGRPPVYDWRKIDRLLGTASDRIIAASCGCTELTIWRRRERLGVPAWFVPKTIKQEFKP